MSHTPGPWVVHRGGPNLDEQTLFVDHPTGKYSDPVAQCYSANLPEYNANARLIAAAPDMLKALERAEFCIRGYTDSSKRECDLDAIRAAIAKAKGEQ